MYGLGLLIFNQFLNMDVIKRRTVAMSASQRNQYKIQSTVVDVKPSESAEIAFSTNVEPETQPADNASVNYMLLANPAGKKRNPGAPKRNRKEQMSIVDQVRAGNELARVYGGSVVDENEILPVPTLAVLPTPPPATCCVESSSSSSMKQKTENINDAAEPSRLPTFDRWSKMHRPAFLRNIRKEQSDISKNSLSTADSNVSLTKSIDDDLDETRAKQSIVVKVTNSSSLDQYDYRPWDSKKDYPDPDLTLLQNMQKEIYEHAQQDLMQSGMFSGEPNKANAVDSYFDNCGYGRAAITMEDFDITRWSEQCTNKQECNVRDQQQQARIGSRCATLSCKYPHSTGIRCRYDHHTFEGVPILLPLRYHPEPHNILEVIPNIAFCSFACALAYVEREAPRLHQDVRNDRRSLLKFMARRYFGITDPIKPAPMLELHCDYGGRLTTAQFRRLSITHYSFVEYPIAVSVPSRYITQISVTRRIDRNKRQGLHLRVAEQHVDGVAPAPDDLVIDPSAPAAPRGTEARVARARHAATEAAQLKAQGLDPNTKQPKKRTATDANGNQISIDRSHVENLISKTVETVKANPKKKHQLESMLSVEEMRFDNFLSDPQTTEQQTADQIDRNVCVLDPFVDMQSCTLELMHSEKPNKKRKAVSAEHTAENKTPIDEKPSQTANNSASSTTSISLPLPPAKRPVGRPRKNPIVPK